MDDKLKRLQDTAQIIDKCYLSHEWLTQTTKEQRITHVYTLLKNVTSVNDICDDLHSMQSDAKKEVLSFNEMKLNAFEYVVLRLIEWQKEINLNDKNDISSLKALKMLFFVVAAISKNGRKNILLKEVFSEFFAMPFGHMEKFIFDTLREKDGNLNYFQMDNKEAQLKPDADLEAIESSFPGRWRWEIDYGIEVLKNKHSHLINFHAFKLIDLSRSWYSWAKTYSLAKGEGSNSKKIDIQDIISEDKIYYINFLS